MKKYKQFLNESTYVKDLAKVKKIIMSCKTREQVGYAINTLDLLKSKWDDEYNEYDIIELERSIEDKYQSLDQ